MAFRSINMELCKLFHVQMILIQFGFFMIAQMDPYSIVVLMLALLGAGTYFYLNRKFRYWSDRGVPGPRPSLWSLGTTLQIQRNPTGVERDFLRRFGPVYGNYDGLLPTLTVADAELIRQIFVRDFHLFVNQREMNTHHEIANQIIFFAEEDQWKRLRSIASPCFTSGKLRAMNVIMDQCVDKLVIHLEQICARTGTLENIRDASVGFSLDVLAATMFGTETPDQENPFHQNAIRMFQFSPAQILSFYAFPSWVNQLLRIEHPFNVKAWDFFVKFSREILGQRKQQKRLGMRRRSDLIDALIDSEGESSDSKVQKVKLTENEIIAQAIAFMVGGYDTTAATLSHVLYELAQNPHVQGRLLSELEIGLAGVEPNGTDAYYEAVNRLVYLDAVIKETLRKYPPFTRLERRYGGHEPYQLGDTGITIEHNQLIEIPAIAVHYNPEYYPAPDQFDPSRFLPENRHNLVPYSFVPFGYGPRNCLGQQFAIQELKLCLAKIIPRFRFAASYRTPVPLNFELYRPILTANFELKIEKRH